MATKKIKRKYSDMSKIQVLLLVVRRQMTLADKTVSEYEAIPFKPIYLILSFLSPVVILGTVFALHKLYPFGDNQILTSDAWHQYYPFLSELWHRLRSGSSLLWSWTAGGGMDYLGFFAYYLSSPLNLLIVMVPYVWLREAMAVLILIKIGLAGLFMGLYLQNTFRRCDMSLPVFAMFYALCAFTLGYYWNIMWLDTFALLPLVMFGLYSIVKYGKYRVFIISLALSVFSNYFIGFYICVYVAIIFFCQSVIYRMGFKEFCSKLILIGVCSVIALGLTALLIIPAFLALQNTVNVTSSFPTEIKFYYKFTDVLSNLIAFTTPTKITGMPNIYCGMLTVLLSIVFICSPKIRLREKTAYITTAVFLIFCCNLNILDYIFNGFYFVTQIPFRFSFLFSFTLVVMAYRAYVLLDQPNQRDMKSILLNMLFMCVGASLILIMAKNRPQENRDVIKNAILCSAYIIAYFMLAKGKSNIRRFAQLAIIIIVVAEVFMTAYIGIEAISFSERGVYPDKYDQVQQLLNMRQSADSDFYRTEFTKRYTWFNDPFLYNYQGISLSSSSASEDVTNFLSGLGLARRHSGKRYGYSETSPLINAFLNMRYIVSRSGNPADYDDLWKLVGEVDGTLLLENNYYLPMGFIVNEEVSSYVHGITNPDGVDPFSSQNNLFQQATGLNENLFEIIDVLEEKHENYSTTTRISNSEGFEFIRYNLHKNEKSGYLRWDYEMPRDGMLYAFCSITNTQNVKVLVNDKSHNSINITFPYMFPAGYFRKGDIVSFLTNISAQYGNANIRVGYLNREIFNEGYALLADETLHLTKFSDTKITGYITAINDGLLYTSIPYENKWKAFVDGKQTEIVAIDNCMAAVKVSKGTHDIEFRYYNEGLKWGVIISAASLATFLAMIITDKKK